MIVSKVMCDVRDGPSDAALNDLRMPVGINVDALVELMYNRSMGASLRFYLYLLHHMNDEHRLRDTVASLASITGYCSLARGIKLLRKHGFIDVYHKTSRSTSVFIPNLWFTDTESAVPGTRFLVFDDKVMELLTIYPSGTYMSVFAYLVQQAQMMSVDEDTEFLVYTLGRVRVQDEMNFGYVTVVNAVHALASLGLIRIVHVPGVRHMSYVISPKVVRIADDNGTAQYMDSARAYKRLLVF